MRWGQDRTCSLTGWKKPACGSWFFPSQPKTHKCILNMIKILYFSWLCSDSCSKIRHVKKKKRNITKYDLVQTSVYFLGGDKCLYGLFTIIPLNAVILRWWLYCPSSGPDQRWTTGGISCYYRKWISKSPVGPSRKGPYWGWGGVLVLD